ncbi:MAG: V-type ATP synthase subunit D [Planctomycetota bacterium]
MKQDLKPTRAELRVLKRRLGVVRWGHKLLKRKQEALMAEFFKNLAQYREAERATAVAMAAAGRAVTLAEMAAGRVNLWSFAMTRAGRMTVATGRTGFMGTTLPEIRPVHDHRETELIPGESVYNFQAALEAEKLVAQLIHLAAVEARTRVLLDEIERTKRRVNALERRVIPSLEEDQKFIEGRLDELEREALFALKRIRAKIGTRQ